MSDSNTECTELVYKINALVMTLSAIRNPSNRLDNIKMDLVEVRWGDVDWIGLAQDRDRWRALVNSVLNLRVP
jgi:hypothetical protein